MVTREQIIAEARSWLGTPFHHQGRLKGVGADCAGVVIGTANALNLTSFDTVAYARQPDGAAMQAVLEAQMLKISVDEIQYGDVILFAFDRDPQHVGFYTDIGLLHSYAQVKKCIEVSLDATWRARIRGVYRFKGIE